MKIFSPILLFSIIISATWLSCKRGGEEDPPQPVNCESVNPLVFKKGSGKLALPDAFTPNDDGKNDIFQPVFDSLDINDYSMSISLGPNLIFSSNNIANGWAGRNSSGATCQPGRYAVNIRFRIAEGVVKDTCNYVTLLATKPATNCILTHGINYSFADQIDPANPDKGFVRTTSEIICP